MASLTTKGKTLLRTYTDCAPFEIRQGDKVQDSRGRIFTATATPEMVLGDWHVNGYDPNGKLTAYTIDNGTTVSITTDEQEDVYAY